MKASEGVDPRVYWIWAQRAFGAGSGKPFTLFRRFSGGLREFYEGGPSLWNRLEFISEKEAASLYANQLSSAQALLEYCLKTGQEVLTPESENYPEALRNIYDPPAVLYLKGTLPDFNENPGIAVVGARKALPKTLEAAKGFGYQLASGGATVISGCAVGVDACSLLGALSASGRPVSVLPTCLDSNYVAENEALRRRVLEQGGALLSEYAVEQGVQHGTFQVRNRIISGLSSGVLVLQAAQKSGTLITARHAIEQDRDVFVYPGPEGAAAFEGGRRLIEDGAKAVTSGEEILEEYAARFSHGQKPKKPVPLFEDLFPAGEREAVLADSSMELSREAEAVFKVLLPTPLHISQLEEKTALSPSQVLSALTELELAGKVKSYPGKRFGSA